MEHTEKNSVLSFDAAQAGDVQTSDIAGRDIHNIGVGASELLDFIQTQLWQSDQAHSMHIEQLQAQLRMVHTELWVLRAIIAALVTYLVTIR